MKWLRAFAPAGAALAVAWLLGGPGSGGQPAAPQLVQVLDVAPHEVERGDAVAIVGEGFPSGKPARVTFRGTLHRPGERPVRGAEIVTDGTVVGPERVQVPFGEAAEALFCGAGDHATHTTFEGDIEVAFAAAAPGAPPVGGTLPGVTFDVRPSMRSADLERDAEGDKVLAWIGVRVASAPTARAAAGLAVEAVETGSRAEAAGIVPGDVLTAFDGVRVASAGDVVPAPGEREATVTVRRPGMAGDVSHTVAVAGFRRAPLTELIGPLLAVLVALAIVLLFAAPTPVAVAGMLDGVVASVRSRVGSATGGGSPWARLGRSLSAVAWRALPPAGPQALVDAASGALLALMPFGQYLVAAQLDVGILFVGGATSLVTAALVAGASPLRGLKAALHVVWQHAPGAVAVACVVVTTGSLRVQEIDRAQGGSPWEWLAFRSPASLVALLLLLSCGRIQPADGKPRAGLAAVVDHAGAPSPSPRGPWLEAACRAHRVVIAGLASALLLGGWRLPGVAPAVQDARPLLELAGAALFLGKTWGLVVALAWVEWLSSDESLLERTRSTAVRTVPLSLVTLAGTAAWAWWRPAPAVELLASGALVVLAVMLLAALVARIRHAVPATRTAAPDGAGHVSVFL